MLKGEQGTVVRTRGKWENASADHGLVCLDVAFEFIVNSTAQIFLNLFSNIFEFF